MIRITGLNSPAGLIPMGLAFLVLGVACSAQESLRAEPESTRLLQEAFRTYRAELGRWAYTETHRASGPGNQPEAESVVRFDPSLPYAEQFTPEKLAGNPPKPKDLRAWARFGENSAERRSANPLPGVSEVAYVLNLNGQEVVPLLDEAIPIVENDAAVTYRVPLRKARAGQTTIFEEVTVEVRVGRQSRQFEAVTLRQLESRRVGAGKFTGGITEIEFGSPQPGHSLVPVRRVTRATNKPLFGPANERETTTVRRDFRRVTPYEERFGVEIGPVRVIDF